MADKSAELSDNIEFLPTYGLSKEENCVCKHLSNHELNIILSLAQTNKHSREIIIELLRPVWIEPEKKCWFRSKDWSHYSRVNKKQAHRLSYEIFRGSLIQGWEICHNCDRKGCVNPWHLFQGSHSDNMKDSRNKGNRFNIN